MAIEFSKKVNEIIEKKLSAMDVADARFLAGFEPIEKKIYEAVRKKVLDMNFESGKSLFDDENVQIINELNDVISNAISSSGYPKKVNEYLRSFDTIKEFNFDAHKDVNDLSQDELEQLINPVQKQVVQQTIDGLTGSGIDTQFIQPMKEGIFKNIVSGATITDLESYLKSYILSDELSLGKFKKYTTQIARDTLNQFDGQVNSRIANEFGLNAYKYVGSLIQDSRPQCVRWVGKGTLLLDELQTEISWANSNGSGMIPGTNPENFSVYRGGYNCRHSAIPFKMTKSQIEKYNREQTKIDEQPIETETGKEVQPLTPAQRDLNLTYNQSPLTPDNLKSLGLPDQLFILSDDGKADITNGDSFYTPFRKTATLGLNSQRAKDSKIFASRVTIHEYNHRIHTEKKLFLINKLNNNPVHEKAFIDSFKLFKEKYPTAIWNEWETRVKFNWNTLVDKYDGKIEGLTRADVDELVGGYLDTICAFTKGVLGDGHSKKYFTEAKGSKRQMEWFAHCGENYWLGNPVFKSEFPELYEQMNDYYKKNVVDVYLKDYLK